MLGIFLSNTSVIGELMLIFPMRKYLPLSESFMDILDIQQVKKSILKGFNEVSDPF
jgi:hypothetical protein